MSDKSSSVFSIETSTSFMERTTDGIVVVRKKNNSFVDIEAALEDTEAHRKLAGATPSPSLIILNEMMNASAETREHFSSKIHEEYRSAEAFVINNLALRILVNFYMKTVKKKYPIRVFYKEEEALTWLRTFL